MAAARTRPFRILLVEDNPGDVLLTQEAFADAKIAVEIDVVDDGTDAIARLQELAEARPRVLPDLVLLDLNLPGQSGNEILAFIRDHADLGHLPVIMLTSSQAPDDIMESYRLHVSSFITKPVVPGEFLDAVRAIEDYWLTVVRLPTTDA